MRDRRGKYKGLEKFYDYYVGMNSELYFGIVKARRVGFTYPVTYAMEHKYNLEVLRPEVTIELDKQLKRIKGL